MYFLHGLLGTAYAHFGDQLRRWADQLAVVPVDLPGHGRCRVDASEPYLDLALEYLTAVVSRFGRGHLIGASYLGGPLAVRFALAQPNLVESVTLTGFAPGLDKDVFVRWLFGFHALARRDGELAGQYDRLHGPRWCDTLAAYSADIEHHYERLALVRPEDLGALRVKLLIVNGSFKSVERTAAEHAAELGPQVRGVVIEGAGHIASHDAPDRFGAAVEAFWRDGRKRTQSDEPRSQLATR